MPTESEKTFSEAQTYLKSVSNGQGINLYDHLTKILTKILDERPSHIVDIFEDLSLTIKDQTVSGFAVNPQELWLGQVKNSTSLLTVLMLKIQKFFSTSKHCILFPISWYLYVPISCYSYSTIFWVLAIKNKCTKLDSVQKASDLKKLHLLLFW